MYLEFNKAYALLRMPCSQLLAKPMSEFSHEPTTKHLAKVQDIGAQEEKDVGKQRESTASPAPSSSSSSCSSQERGMEEEVVLSPKEVAEAKKDGGHDGDDDDGYRTPTSPSHRIAIPTVCPPAPKKPMRSLRLKRKRGRSRARWHIDVDVDDLRPKAKKARRDPDVAE